MKSTWIDDKFFEVSFDAGLKIYYKLFNNDLTDRWIQLVNHCNDSNFKLNSTHTKIYSKKEINDLFEEFVDVIELINTVIDNKLPDIKSLKYLAENKELLNYLHEQYEIYGETNDPPIINKPMLRFNDLIHSFESIIKNESCCFSVINTDYQKTNIALLKPEDYFLFTPDIEWGYMYLGYNTLGKNWNTVADHNDIEVVQRNQVKPQKNFSSEFYINFNERKSYVKKNNFYNWWVENDFSKTKKETFTIEDFCFGFIPLGKIIYYTINDELDKVSNSKLIYDIDPINTPEARLEWNKNIWSKQNFTTKIQLVEAFTNV
jgi:hypothetical protein